MDFYYLHDWIKLQNYTIKNFLKNIVDTTANICIGCKSGNIVLSVLSLHETLSNKS
ncbi:hypothetical protein [Wolbachia endosymbiont of Ostrinia scapulalis]|uniref:hypothetical protein n=1 Tax=Wolbachia endosymbiont of Ostrinia scapulalis TaxID=183754 RepID=UPI0020221950|nr:hypothetical protein [Wolbachia endosymbiont of Ostrinia scapulalis]URG41086.1 hypothetical protein M1L26_000063 [Wolbachia endosymbiont of Ostrinia scapulalis]